MFNPDDYPYYEVYLRSFKEQREALALDVTPMRVHSDAEIDAAIAQLAAVPEACDRRRGSRITLLRWLVRNWPRADQRHDGDDVRFWR
jgi:hypothetical protein